MTQPTTPITRVGFGRTADIFPWSDAPDGSPRVIKQFHAWMSEECIRREADATRALYAAGLPVPRVDEMLMLDGQHSIVYERVEGELLSHRLRRQPWRARWVGRLMADLHAQMHAIQVGDLPPLRERLREAIQCAPDTLPEQYRTRALAAPDDLLDGDNVCHMDFHIENVMLAPSGPVIIDWMTATRGHPLADVVRSVYMIAAGKLPYRLPAYLRLGERVVRTVMLNAYMRRYFALTGADRGGMRAWVLPIVAARFAEGIDEEIPARLRILAALDAGQATFG